MQPNLDSFQAREHMFTVTVLLNRQFEVQLDPCKAGRFPIIRMVDTSARLLRATARSLLSDMLTPLEKSPSHSDRTNRPTTFHRGTDRAKFGAL